MLDLISGRPATLFGSGITVDVGRLLISVVILSMGAFLSLRGTPDVPRTHFESSDVYLSVRKSTGSTQAKKISLRDFVELKLPSLRLPFVPVWWLFK